MIERGYILSANRYEIDRLAAQVRAWEPAAERMLTSLGISAGACCIDLGCGPEGILGPLSRRVGPNGRAVGVDRGKMVQLARMNAERSAWINVEILEADAYETGLPSGAFDLVHARFMFAPTTGRRNELIREMIRLAAPGGIIVSQEPDTSPQGCSPSAPAWELLKNLQREVFVRGGADPDAGRDMYALMRHTGLQDVQVRGEILTMTHDVPYARHPILFGLDLRDKIVAEGLATEEEVDALLKACELIVQDPDIYFTSLLLVQTSGKKPR